jgi:hypothetical protein
MAINFPSSPALNQTFTDGTTTWSWSGVSWEVKPITTSTYANLTVTGNITGTLIGNADTATLATTANALTTARTINGTAFDGTNNITVSADAGTLTNTTLNNTVVNSSLTSVGTLTDLEVAGDITADTNIVIATTPTLTTHATNKKYVDTRSIAMSIAMS